VHQIAITSGALGMGLATAQLLASRGAVISIADINEAAMQTAVASLTDSHKHIYSAPDVRGSQSVNVWIQSTVKKLGKVDGAVNMAGIIRPVSMVAELTDDNWDFTFAVNVRGVFNCIRAQLQAMKDGGSIVRLGLEVHLIFDLR
jgi:NAD(P)-dependent dehydrogenase (short-subunit alcohol dehydrogenase family)